MKRCLVVCGAMYQMASPDTSQLNQVHHATALQLNRRKIFGLRRWLSRQWHLPKVAPEPAPAHVGKTEAETAPDKSQLNSVHQATALHLIGADSLLAQNTEHENPIIGIPVAVPVSRPKPITVTPILIKIVISTTLGDGVPWAKAFKHIVLENWIKELTKSIPWSDLLNNYQHLGIHESEIELEVPSGFKGRFHQLDHIAVYRNRFIPQHINIKQELWDTHIFQDTERMRFAKKMGRPPLPHTKEATSRNSTFFEHAFTNVVKKSWTDLWGLINAHEDNRIAEFHNSDIRIKMGSEPIFDWMDVVE